MKKKFFVVAVVFFSSYTQGQDTAAITLDEVIVTANKTEQKQSTTGKVITIIDQACLKRNAGRTISEILNYQSGIFINGANNTLGSNQDFYFRGSSTGNVLVLIDGIPVGDPSQINNGFDLNSLSIPSIERIEILKGAQSTLWGSDAVSGVINIITKKKGTKKISPSVILSFGSYHTGRAAAGINGTISNFSYNVSHSYTRSRGFSSAYDSTGSKQFDKDGFRQHNFQARLGYRWSPDLSISSLLSSGTYTADIDAGAFTDDRDFIATNKNNLYSIDAAFTRSKRTLHFINSWSQAKRTFKDDSGHVGGFANYAAAKYTGSSFISELFADIHLSGNVSLLAGIQSHWQKTDQYYKSSSSFGLYETAIGDSAKTNNISFYTSFLVTWVGKLNTELGFRYNLHNIYGNNSSFSFNPSYTIDDHKKIFISDF